MDNTELQVQNEFDAFDEVIDVELRDELAASEVSEVDDDTPDVDLVEKTITRIHKLFDDGFTKTAIAKELNIARADVIEVLGKYVGRNKINGTEVAKTEFQFNPAGKIRVELGDRLNTSIYVKEGDDIEAAKAKWLKILNNNND